MVSREGMVQALTSDLRRAGDQGDILGSSLLGIRMGVDLGAARERRRVRSEGRLGVRSRMGASGSYVGRIFVPDW